MEAGKLGLLMTPSMKVKARQETGKLDMSLNVCRRTRSLVHELTGL